MEKPSSYIRRVDEQNGCQSADREPVVVPLVDRDDLERIWCCERGPCPTNGERLNGKDSFGNYFQGRRSIHLLHTIRAGG